MPSRRRKPRHPSALTDFPPLRILRAILLLQLAFYTTFSVLVIFTALVAGQPVTLRPVIDWRLIRGDNALGWIWGAVAVLAGGVLATLALLLLVHRSKLVPDFALTMHGLHLLATTLFTRRLPASALWWGLELASTGTMVALGVWACRYRELKPISFGGKIPTVEGEAGKGDALEMQPLREGQEGDPV